MFAYTGILFFSTLPPLSNKPNALPASAPITKGANGLAIIPASGPAPAATAAGATVDATAGATVDAAVGATVDAAAGATVEATVPGTVPDIIVPVSSAGRTVGEKAPLIPPPGPILAEAKGADVNEDAGAVAGAVVENPFHISFTLFLKGSKIFSLNKPSPFSIPSDIAFCLTISVTDASSEAIGCC